MPQSSMAKRRPSKTGKAGGRPTSAVGGGVEFVKTVVYAILIALILRTLAYEPFNIPSGSMIPTLLIGDYLFVEKWAYGYSHFSLPFSPDLFSGRILGSVPKRGDVVVFKLPRDTSIDYIKRIVGLPGDTVQMKDGLLYINGQQVPRTYVKDYVVEGDGPRMVDKEYMETLPGGGSGAQHLIIKESDQGGMNDTEEYHVPPGYVFAMGDNRDNSEDSRYLNAVGYIPIENLVGKAQIIFFSVDAQAPWWEFWEWPFEIRWSRLFNLIT
jgi:signal peptidase I